MSQRLHPSRIVLCTLAALLPAAALHAQVSLNSTLDLALARSPRVQGAVSDLDRAKANLSEATAPYIPTASATTAYGRVYGFPLGTPSIVNVNVGSLLYSPSQHDYVLAARAGINAAVLGLTDVQQSVQEDVALTYFAVLKDQQREILLAQQVEAADRLVGIVAERQDAGLDSAVDLTTARLGLANLRLTRLRNRNDLAYDRSRLAGYTGMPADTFLVQDDLPDFPPDTPPASYTQIPLSAGVAASYANAKAKLIQAQGDARYLYRPQITFGFQYAVFSTTYGNYNKIYGPGVIQTNNLEVGAQLTIPFYDRNRKAKAQESAAIASRALHDADYSRVQWVDAQTHLYNQTAELRARKEVASLELQLAQQQLAIVQLQLTEAHTGPAPQITPKDEQNSRISALDKQLTIVDSTYSLRQTELTLLHQNGHLADWIRQIALQPVQPVPLSGVVKP